MGKAKRSLVRIERIDGTTIASGLTGDDQDELLAMVGDALAFWLHDNPRKWRTARKMMRRVLLEWRLESPFDWLTHNVGWNIIGAGLIAAAIYGVSCIAHLLGVC